MESPAASYPLITVTASATCWVTDTCRLEPGLEVTHVYVGSVLFALLRPGDTYQAKFVAAHLVALGVANATQVARAFDFGPTSVREWVIQLRQAGTLHPGDFKRGPAGPRKMTPAIFEYLTTHPARSDQDRANQIAQRFGVRLSSQTVRFYRLQAHGTLESRPEDPTPPTWEQPSWWTEPETAGDFDTAPPIGSPGALAARGSSVPSPLGRPPDPEFTNPGPALGSAEARSVAETGGGAGTPIDSGEPAGHSETVSMTLAPLALEASPVLTPPPGLPAEGTLVAAAGALVLAPYFQALALPAWTAAHPWPRPHDFAPLSVLYAWILAFLLGLRSAESTKMGPRPDWGWVIGAPHYPHPDTLRALTHEWTNADLGPDLAAHCGPRYLALFPEAPAILYLDGHFIPYTGHAAYAGRGYSTLRHLVMPGHEQFWAHDAQGHPLWVDEAAGDASFYHAIISVSQRVQQWRTGRLLVVYDRGGVSMETAATLVAQEIDFLCYGKTRAVPSTAVWTPLTLERAGRSRSYEVWEHTRKWGDLPAVREIWVRDGAKTFPVLTSQATRTIPELLTALWGRWVQENGFKRLVQDYGLNHFGDRTMAPLENRQVANPQRTRLKRILAKLDQGMGALRRRYPHPTDGDQLADDAPRTAQTRWAQLRQRLLTVSAAYEAAPEQVALWDLVPEDRRHVFTFQQKAFQDACRIIAVNGEHWIRRQLAPLYPDPRHERRLVQWLLRARGTVRWDSDHLEITLERPARPRWAQAIAALLMEINAQDPRYPADPRYSIQFTLRAARKM